MPAHWEVRWLRTATEFARCRKQFDTTAMILPLDAHAAPKLRKYILYWAGPSTPVLLATVHWVVCEEQARSVDEVLARTYAWNERKKQFTPRQLKLAAGVLADKGWIDHLNE